MKRLFIAEKPSMGATIAEYISKINSVPMKKNGSSIEVGNDIVTWQRGHFLELAFPEEYDPKFKKWTWSDLPIIPDPWRMTIKADAAAQLKVIGSLLKGCDEVIHAGDPDAEGQALVDNVLLHFKCKKPVRRLWTPALDDKNLAKAFSSIKSNTEYQRLYQASQARSHADWLFGINMSRACTICARQQGADFVMSIGRVQTPTLALIVNREKEIRNFKPVDYFTPWLESSVGKSNFQASWIPKEDDDRIDHEGRLTDRKIAEGIEAAVKKNGQAVVSSYESNKETESAPLLFSLSTLQAHASRVYGLPVAKTLEIAQSLYDKKITSYPRTDCEYLPDSQHADAPDILSSLMKASLPVSFSNALRGARSNLKSRSFNSKKVSAHHAIAPVGADPAKINSLSDIEKKIYFEIVKRYILQFWPVAQFMNTTVFLESAGEIFKVAGRHYLDEGWKKAFVAAKDEDEDENTIAGEEKVLPEMKEGDVIPVTNTGIRATTTKPPKRFTEGSLITAMENIHQYVKDPQVKKRLKGGNGDGAGDNKQAGIGTVATRANIIKTLFSRNFIELKKKDIVPTQTGEKVIDILPVSMTSPDMTAIWQTLMDSILDGNSTYDAFMEKQTSWLKGMINSTKDFFANVEFSGSKKAGAASSIRVIDTEEVCSCGTKLQRIEGAKYGTFFACQSKECGKRYKELNGKPAERQVAQSSPDAAPTVSCPSCESGHLRRLGSKDGKGYFWGCSNFRSEKPCKTTFPDLDGKPDMESKRGASSTTGTASTSGSVGARIGSKTPFVKKSTPFGNINRPKTADVLPE